MPVLIESIYFDFYLLHLSKGLCESAVIKKEREMGGEREKEGGRERHRKWGSGGIKTPARNL